MNQKLLGLFLVSSLLAVHPICSADWPVVQKLREKMPNNSQKAALGRALLLGVLAYKCSASEEGSTLPTLQALKEYALGASELKFRKGATAASLALLYAAHRYYKSKPVSAVAALASLIPLYSAYKDIPLVRDVLLAKAGKEVEDKYIIEYMDSLCFNPNLEYGLILESYPGQQFFGYDDGYLTNKRLLGQFFAHYNRK